MTDDTEDAQTAYDARVGIGLRIVCDAKRARDAATQDCARLLGKCEHGRPLSPATVAEVMQAIEAKDAATRTHFAAMAVFRAESA